MKTVKDVSEIIKETSEVVVEAFNRQVKQVVRLVTKPPKKPPLSWESIIGDDGRKKTTKVVDANTVNLPALPLVNQLLAQLSNEIFESFCHEEIDVTIVVVVNVFIAQGLLTSCGH